jgi:hypothetical protein
MYARCHRQPSCLHSSNCTSHCSIAAAGEDGAHVERVATDSCHGVQLLEKSGQLLGGDFARRIKRAGIVNFSYLVIAKSEHLPEDFVGVFPKQRRA